MSNLRSAWIVAGLTFVIHMLTNGRYGYFRDELYFIACGHHPAWGYVALPPFVAFLDRLSNFVFPSSLILFRMPAALAHTATIVMSGNVCRKFGGGKYAIFLTSIAVAGAPVFLAGGNLMTMNVFESLLWLGLELVILSLIQTQNSRLWFPAGALFALAILNKYTVLFYAFALFVAILFSSQRKILKSKRFLSALILALLILLPHLIWLMTHNFPMIEVMRTNRNYLNTTFHFSSFLLGQLSQTQPIVALLWMTGLYSLLKTNSEKHLAPFAVSYFILLIFCWLGEAKIYYLAPVYPFLISCGATTIEKVLSKIWMRVTAALILICNVVVSSPFAIPVLSLDNLVKYEVKHDINVTHFEKSVSIFLGENFSDQMIWPDLADSVRRVFANLSEAEKAQTTILAENYGEAAAIDFFNVKKNLPQARSGHDDYFLWGPGSDWETVIAIGRNENFYKKYFASVQLADRVPINPFAKPWESGAPIFICRHPLFKVSEIWSALRIF